MGSKEKTSWEMRVIVTKVWREGVGSKESRERGGGGLA